MTFAKIYDLVTHRSYLINPQDIYLHTQYVPEYVPEKTRVKKICIYPNAKRFILKKNVPIASNKDEFVLKESVVDDLITLRNLMNKYLKI